MKISIETEIDSNLNEVWTSWVSPQDIVAWNFASDEWCCPKADIDLTVGGRFSYRMEAKDGSMGFDFSGEFVAIEPNKSLRYKMADDREVVVQFTNSANGVIVVETFDAEDEHSAEQQRSGWLCILNNFKKHVEHKSD